MRELAGIFCALAGMALAQPGGVPSTVTGKVTDALSGVPVVRAKISMQCTTRQIVFEMADVLSGADGAFAFKNVPGGEAKCFATATRNGYVGLLHIAVSAGRLDMRVVPQSVVSGTVLDENGVPEPSAPLQLWQRILRDGSYRMFSIASRGTDDRGRFRMAQLSAGSYRVCVTAWATGYMSSRDLTYEGICYSDGSDSVDSERLELKTGETRDLRFQLRPVRGVRVSGRIYNSPGFPSVQLTHPGPDGRRESLGSCRLGSAPKFDCLAVVPGEYSVDASYTRPGSAPIVLAATKTVTLESSDVTDVELKLLPDAELLGRIAGADRSAISTQSFRVHFVSLHRDSAVDVRQDGSFRATLSPSESYRIRLGVLEPWHIQSIRQGDRDITGGILRNQSEGSWGQLEITVSQSHGTVDGVVHEANGENCVVQIVERQDGVFTRVAVSRVSGEEHRIEATNLAPGEYFVFASRIGVELPYLDAAYLASNKDVVLIHVVEGITSHLELNPVSADSGFVH
jgi:hypothetical protein